MQKNRFHTPVQSCDLARAACLARQIQHLALSGSPDPDAVEALAEALAFRLELAAAALEGVAHD